MVCGIPCNNESIVFWNNAGADATPKGTQVGKCFLYVSSDTRVTAAPVSTSNISVVPSKNNSTVSSLVVLPVTWSIGSLSKDSSTHVVSHDPVWLVGGLFGNQDLQTLAKCPVLPHLKHL